MTPLTPAAAQALRHDARNPSAVHGTPSLFVRMTGLTLSVVSSMALRGAPTRTETGTLVLLCRSLMRVPSYAAQVSYLREGYWLYVAFDCATPKPRLVRVCDPFGRLLARAKGSVVIQAGQINSH